METVLQDVRDALRSLRRTPGFVAIAIVTLALGTGLATAVFTVAETLLLRPLPVQDQDRLVVLWGEARDRAFNYPLDLEDASEFARRTRSLKQIAFFSYYGAAPKPMGDGGQSCASPAPSYLARSSRCLARGPCLAERCTRRTTSADSASLHPCTDPSH